ncbi:hypothetical protein LWC34_45290 [Kibdelosporangium philippinense]|uniref:Helicase ATP-binding domain-containing protein n=1 Tax=Kibdelosporangium philippinense TaxID=211113 RepID=A0ABS8ZQE0_9PSEU|nr:DEAD/DEAH box helicase [Kibdelosporangium philippinense]MCE7009975.1 hypothetical protein [Kibdelosporangium philippinense]
MAEVNFERRLQALASGAFADLRPTQRHVLSEFATNHLTSSDVGIELPTGEGKTLIALLIADWALDEGMSVAYLTGTKQLAEQVEQEATGLPDLPVHRFYSGHYPGAAVDDYHQAQAVGVMNYWVYFNSRPKIEPADLVIFDDAHLAEQPLTSLFTMRIPRNPRGGTTLYQELCDLILQQAPDAYPTLKALRDGAAPPASPPELIAFNDWASIADTASDLVDESIFLAADRSARIVWQEALRSHITRCGVLIGPSALEIRPYHPPTHTVSGYSASKKRIYLSATLGRPGDLQRRLGTRPLVAIETPDELRVTSTGRRTFLINPLADEGLDTDPFDFALDQSDSAAADGPGRVAWLCASNPEADHIENRLVEAGRTVFRLQAGDDSPIDQWRVTSRAHLVTAGRFDGLDFPGETCRLVIIPSVPAASTEFERFVMAYLGDAAYMRHRVGQRVTQALGRANRSETDSALYLGLDAGFANALADSTVRASLGSDVQQVVRRALELHGKGWSAVIATAQHFWRTHRDHIEAPETPASAASRSGRARPGRKVTGAAGVDSADNEVEAINRLWLGDYRSAADYAQTAGEKLADGNEPEHSAFWRYVQAHALYLQHDNRSARAAQDAIKQAITSAPRTAWFVRLSRTADELKGSNIAPATHDSLFLEWDKWIREVGSKLPGRLARARTMLMGTHDERCEALQTLAQLCGATGDRPKGPSATDARWVWATSRKGQRRVWEVKTGSGPEAVPRDDINQLLGQLRVEQDKHPSAVVTGCLLTVLADVEQDAADAARSAITLLHEDAAEALFDQMQERFMAYHGAFGSGSAAERGEARGIVEKQLPQGEWLARLLSPSNGKLVRKASVLRIFG